MKNQFSKLNIFSASLAVKPFLFVLLSAFIFLNSCKKEDHSKDSGYTVISNDGNSSNNDNTDGENEENESTQKLVVTVDNINTVKGLINFALYNSSATFNDPDKAFREYFIEVTDKPLMQFEFDDIPPGTYALALFHDENSNYELDQNFIGIPQEGFGFSNNAFGNFGPPNFNAAKFDFPENTTVTLAINLRFF